MHAVFARLEWDNQARTIASAYFSPESHYRFEAGQYANFIIPHIHPDDRGTGRVMTLASSPDEELLRITFKYYGRKGSTYKRALVGLKPGDPVIVQEAMGDLVLPLSSEIPLIWIAGGVGIASFSGMTRYLTDHQEKRAIRLYYAVAGTQDIIMQDIFDGYPLTKKVYVRPKRLKVPDILSGSTDDTLIYLSGPEYMVESLRHEIEASGIPRSRIVFDYYEGYSEL